MSRFILNSVGELEKWSGVPRTQYSNLEEFADHFGSPELTAELIMQDYGCSWQQANLIAWLSEDFGFREYPFRENCSVMEITKTTQFPISQRC